VSDRGAQTMAHALMSKSLAVPPSGSQPQWRRLSDVVGALIERIEPVPATTGSTKAKGATARCR